MGRALRLLLFVCAVGVGLVPGTAQAQTPPPSGAFSDPLGTLPAPLQRAPLEIGVVSGSDGINEPERMRSLNLPITRLEFDAWTPASRLRESIAAFAKTNTRVLLLAGFHKRIPTPAHARNLGEWAREFGPGGSFWAGRSDGHLAVREIEFGNETSYAWQYGDNWDKPSFVRRARIYALRARDAIDAVNAANDKVGVLVQADDANTGSSRWVDTMLRTVPDLGHRAGGWTVHPYGPESRWAPRLERLVAQTAKAGAPDDVPIYVTEFGISTDNGRCLNDNVKWNRCITYAAAARGLTQSVLGMRRKVGSRLRAVLIYRGRDEVASRRSRDREHYFGVLRHDGAEKGAYTAAVRALIESARARTPLVR